MNFGSEKEVKEKFLKLVEKFMFKIVPDRLTRLFGEGVAIALLYDMVREGSRELARELLNDLPRNDLKSVIEAFLNLTRMVNGDFDYSVNGGEVLELTIRKCPHSEYIDKAPYRCIACIATLSGFIEGTDRRVQVVYGNRKVGNMKPDVVIEMNEHMPLGHKRCVMRISERKRLPQLSSP